jgi:hypothetical protein
MARRGKGPEFFQRFLRALLVWVCLPLPACFTCLGERAVAAYPVEAPALNQDRPRLVFLPGVCV